MRLLILFFAVLFLTGCQEPKERALELRRLAERQEPASEAIIVVAPLEEDGLIRQMKVMSDQGYKPIYQVVSFKEHFLAWNPKPNYVIMYRPRKGHKWSPDGKHII